jgi:hypothetical protein
MTQAWESFQRLSTLTHGRQLVDADYLKGKMDLCQQSSARKMCSRDENTQYSISWLAFCGAIVCIFLLSDVKETLLEKWLCGAELRSFNFHLKPAGLNHLNLSRLPCYDGKA